MQRVTHRTQQERDEELVVFIHQSLQVHIRCCHCAGLPAVAKKRELRAACESPRTPQLEIEALKRRKTFALRSESISRRMLAQPTTVYASL